MKVSTQFQETIQTFLDNKAATDELFAVTLQKPGKTIEECCNYIIKCAKEGGAGGYSDSEVYNWAVHYYDEDDIKNIEPIKGQVIVNHQVELTDKEKESIKQKAIAKAIEEGASEHKKTLMDKVELSPEELAVAKQKAIDKVFEEQRQKMIAKKSVKTKTVAKSELGLIIPKEATTESKSTLIPNEIVIPEEPKVDTNGQSSLF